MNQSSLRQYIAPLCALLLSLFLTLGLLLPGMGETYLSSLFHKTPLSPAPLTLTAVSPAFSQEELTHLAGMGTVIPYRSAVCTADNGQTLCLVGMDLTEALPAFALTEGRMPQNEYECVVVSHAKEEPPAVSVSTGTALRLFPADRSDNDTLLSEHMTVVGIGISADALFSAAVPYGAPDGYLYTTPAAFSPDEAPKHVCLLPEDDADKTVQAVLAYCESQVQTREQRLLKDHSLEQSVYKAQAEEVGARATEALILLKQRENDLQTVTLQVKEAEQQLLEATEELERERQEFNSEMELYEYYATNQVTLIGRKNRAEESFAKKEAAIVLLQETLDRCYTALEEATRAKTAAEATYNALSEEVAAANALANAKASLAAPAPWQITRRDTDPGYEAALHTAQKTGYTLLWIAIPAALLLLLAALLWSTREPMEKRERLLMIGMVTAASLCGGALSLYWILPAVLRHLFPAFSALSAVIPVGSHTGGAILIALWSAVCIIAAVEMKKGMGREQNTGM